MLSRQSDGTVQEEVAGSEVGLLCSSPDGEKYYYVNWDNGDLWQRTVDGGEEKLVLRNDSIAGEWTQIVPSPNGIYFTKIRENGHLLAFMDLVTGETDSLYFFDIFDGYGLTLAPDATTLLYDNGEAGCDLVLVEEPFQSPE